MTDPIPFPAVSAHAILASIVESSDDAIVSKDLNGIVTSWNRGAELLFGYSAEEMIGQPILRLIPEGRVSEETDILDRVRRVEKVDHFETVRRRKDGSLVGVSVTVSPVRDASGVVVGASKIARDITPSKLAEELSRESDRRKTEFLAMLGHELRNPLAAIRSSLTVIRQERGSDGLSTAAGHVLDRQVAQLGRLVDDLLDADRISRGRLTLQTESILLSDVLADAVNLVRPRMNLRQQTLTAAAPPHPIVLAADATRLAQVLGNLLDNASKFTDPGGRIELHAERAHTPDGPPTVVLRVRDTGIGLESDHVSSIFDLFTQVDTSLERSVSGLGIGLTLVKRLVELHGGTVSAHSAGLGHGSEFVVTLPVLPEAAVPIAEGGPTTPTVAKSRRILVVDDNQDAADMLTTVLRLGGHDVHAVHDGLAAVDAATTFRPEVILLDIGLPKLNGYEVAKQIRAQQGDRRIAIVALTGWGQDADRRRAVDSGFDTHWVKPVDEATLERFLEDLYSPPPPPPPSPPHPAPPSLAPSLAVPQSASADDASPNISGV